MPLKPEAESRKPTSALFWRRARSTHVPLMAKQTTAPSAATSMALALQAETSANTAATANISPNTLSQSGARTSAGLRACLSDRLSAQIFSQTQLQQESGQSDGRDHNQRKRAREMRSGWCRGPPGQARSRTVRPQRCSSGGTESVELIRAAGGLEAASGKEFRPKLYRVEARFQMGRRSGEVWCFKRCCPLDESAKLHDGPGSPRSRTPEELS